MSSLERALERTKTGFTREEEATRDQNPSKEDGIFAFCAPKCNAMFSTREACDRKRRRKTSGDDAVSNARENKR